MSPEEQIAVVRTVIGGGESYYAEFKSAWHYGPEGREMRDVRQVAQDIARTVVAFANSDGGDLVVGVEDDGAVTGVPRGEDRLRYLVSVPRELVMGDDEDLGVQVRTVELDGKTVLWFRVAEAAGGPVVTSDGRCLWRRGARTEPVPPKEVGRRRDHRLGDLAYEAQPVPAARLDDLDLGSLLGHLESTSEDSPEKLARHRLRYWSLAESRNGHLVLRRAALLLCAKEPLRWHPNNRIRIRRVQGREEGYGDQMRTREREIGGPIVDLVPRARQLLLQELETERRADTLFATTHLLPREALEECLVNAVAHRNYAVEGQAIEVLLYPDRVEIRSPGRLPEPITVADLRQQRGVHRSRNPLIMRVLRDLGWSRDQGEGMRRIFGSMRQVELHVPELEERADTFIVRLSTRSIYNETTQAWIASYGPFGLRPEDRKYMVELRQAGGHLSVDRLARQLDQSFDETKKHLLRLERHGLVWHPYKSRTYHVVEAPNVPHELAYRALQSAKIRLDASTVMERPELEALVSVDDERSLQSLIGQWQQAGILQPAGPGRWKLGTSFLKYLSARCA